MLSRLSVTGGRNLKTFGLKFQPAFAITTSASENADNKTSNPASNHPPEYPPPTSKRDFVNFPRPIMAETAPPVRLGFIPETWFQFLYPKLGYTGPYTLMATATIYCLSKEILVLGSEFSHLMAVIIASSVLHNKFKDKAAAGFNNLLNKEIAYLNSGQENEKKAIRDEIQTLNELSKGKTAIEELTKGTVEFIQMQMELAFRERLRHAYQEVKNKIDCQAEMENVERRIIQRNLTDYVLMNVMKSITPDMEKNSVQLCIKDLNALSSKS